MFLGRPVNLWLGLIQGVSSAILGMTSALLPDNEAKVVGILLAGTGTILGILIAFVGNAPPTLSPGDTFNVKTAKGSPNYTTVVAHPPAQDAPPMPQGAEDPDA